MISAGSLGELLTHPEVARFVDRAVLVGVSGRTQVDIAIGYVETALAHLTRQGKKNEGLQRCYDTLRADPTFRLYFPGSNAEPQETTRKPETYKACNGF